jgi:hypothetical protein
MDEQTFKRAVSIGETLKIYDDLLSAVNDMMDNIEKVVVHNGVGRTLTIYICEGSVNITNDSTENSVGFGESQMELVKITPRIKRVLEGFVMILETLIDSEKDCVEEL